MFQPIPHNMPHIRGTRTEEDTMIIYSKTVSSFIDDIVDGTLDEQIESIIMQRYGRHTPASERNAWRNSLTYMGNIIGRADLPGDAGIAVEYGIPYTSKRVDLIVSGKGDDGRNTAVIIELKQWSSVEEVPGKDGIVSTVLGRGHHETTHPSYQAWSYAMAISDFNADVQDRDVLLQPCACLHNYVPPSPDPLTSELYAEYVTRAPVFTKHGGKDLQEFLRRFIRNGDGLETIFMIDSGRLRPSKSLQDVLASMMAGNQEFVMLDTQKVVYEEVLKQARSVSTGGGKRVIVVRGGPGTGKSVLAVKLLSELIGEGMSAAYVSKNAAPRKVYGVKLKGTMRRSRVDCLFKGSGSFTDSPENAFDVLLADEAHRLNERSGLYRNLGENQVMEIIRSSRLSVFLIDEDQRVTLSDIGTVDEIRKHASDLGARVTEMELDSQFRCSGSDGYLAWLDDVLQIRGTANIDLCDESFDYDFRVYDDPNELRRDIEERNGTNNRSRMVAGYCWEWISEGKNDSSVHDVTIPEHGFGMSWNMGSTETWAIDDTSINEVGCIHTCQGLEFDYVGVIIGDDMRYSDGNIVTDASKRARTDQSLRGLKSNYSDIGERARVADRIIKNTYKVLMSRGMRGCYVYCTDEGLREHLRRRSGESRQDKAR